MRNKPVISLLRGNTPKKKKVGRRSSCWRCSKELIKNDNVFEVPQPTKRTPNGKHYTPYKRYCIDCMKRNIVKTEQELKKIKNKIK